MPIVKGGFAWSALSSAINAIKHFVTIAILVCAAADRTSGRMVKHVTGRTAKTAHSVRFFSARRAKGTGAKSATTPSCASDRTSRKAVR